MTYRGAGNRVLHPVEHALHPLKSRQPATQRGVRRASGADGGLLADTHGQIQKRGCCHTGNVYSLTLLRD